MTQRLFLLFSFVKSVAVLILVDYCKLRYRTFGMEVDRKYAR